MGKTFNESKSSETVSVNFKRYFKDEYDFLMEQHNKSLFLCELIREYMNSGNIQNVRSSVASKSYVSTTTEEDEMEENTKETVKKKRKISGVLDGQ